MYELELNEENIKKTLESDVLGRNCSIYNFLDLIYSIDAKSTISIDGDWGTGKTFFVKQVEYIMNLLNNSSKENLEPKIQSLIDKIKNKLEEKNVKTDLQKALLRLPERERVLMVLYYQENMTMKEIGATLNMSESRVCQLHAQAIMKLKNIFSENRTSRLQQSIV